MQISQNIWQFIKSTIPENLKVYLKFLYRRPILLSILFHFRPLQLKKNQNNKKKVHIAFDLYMAQFGGLEQVTLALIKSLKKKGDFKFYLFYTLIYEKSELLDEFKKVGVECIYVSQEEYFLDGWQKRSRLLIEITYNLSIDVFCFMYPPYDYEILPFIKTHNPKLKTVCWIHNYFQMDSNIAAIIKFNKYVDRVIVISDYFQKALAKKGRYAEVLFNGIDLDYFDIKSITKRNARALLKIPKEAFICVFIGRLDKNKNPLFILKLAKQMRNKGVLFLIIGTGILERKISDEIKKNNLADIVRLYKYQKDIRQFLAASNTLLLCSTKEGLGLVLLESMAMGNPPIASNFTGVDRIFTNGRHGFIVPLRVTSFVESIYKIKDDKNLYKMLAQEGIKHVMKNYNIENMSKKFLDIIDHT